MPVRELPPGYHEAEYLNVTDPKRLLWLNTLSLVPLAVSLIIVAVWWLVSSPLRAGLQGEGVAWWVVLVGLLVLLGLHEALHGLAMLAFGHRPTFGAKLSQGLLYAISEGAYYRRDVFIAIALAPLVVISAVGLGLMLVTHNSLAFWLGAGVVVNAASAVVDLWMTARALRYPSDALIRDESTGVRFFTPV